MRGPIKKAAWFVAGDVGTRAVGFLVTVYLARTLGIEFFGVISVGIAVLGYLAQFSGSGIQLIEARNVASRQGADPGRIGDVLSLRLAISIVLIASVGAITYSLFTAIETADSISLHALVLIPLAINLDWFFQGKEQFGTLSSSKILGAIVYGLVVFLTISGPADFRYAPAALGLGGVASAVFLLVLFQSRFGNLIARPKPGNWPRLLREHVPVSFAMLLAQNAVNLGPIVLGALYGSGDAGLYSVGMKMIVTLLLLDRTFNGVYLPMASRIAATRPEEMSRILTISLKIAIIVTFPLALCFFAGANQIIDLIFGPGYDGAGHHFSILLVYLVATIPNSICGCSLIASGREAEYTKNLAIGSAVLGILVVVGAVVFGPLGAAGGVALGEWVMFGMFFRVVRKTTSVQVSSILRPMIAVSVMACSTALLIESNLVTTLGISLLAFVVTLFATRGLDQEEIIMLKERLA